MEVKEAIEICKNEFVDYQEDSDIQRVGEDIISLLQQGEAYRQIVEELKKIQEIKIEKNPLNTTALSKLTEIEILEQKYLKEAKQDES